MNYRHEFHAGNFADVMKHVLLVELLRGLQRKEKGFLYLDTHAGRGRYDLAAAGMGTSLERKAEHPDGIGRLLKRTDLSPVVKEYVELVTRFDRSEGHVGEGVRFYPGSPRLARMLARPQDRLYLCEQHAAEAEALKDEFRIETRTLIQAMDGYVGIKAALPPIERRALVLIDPPFEDSGEFARVGEGLLEALRRLPAAVIAVWYPITERSRSEEFIDTVRELRLPPTWTAELVVAGPDDGLSLRGCGLLVVNPPWQADLAIEPALASLVPILAQTPRAASRLRWLIHE